MCLPNHNKSLYRNFRHDVVIYKYINRGNDRVVNYHATNDRSVRVATVIYVVSSYRRYPTNSANLKYVIGEFCLNTSQDTTRVIIVGFSYLPKGFFYIQL